MGRSRSAWAGKGPERARTRAWPRGCPLTSLRPSAALGAAQRSVVERHELPCTWSAFPSRIPHTAPFLTLLDIRPVWSVGSQRAFLATRLDSTRRQFASCLQMSCSLCVYVLYGRYDMSCCACRTDLAWRGVAVCWPEAAARLRLALALPCC